MIKAIYIRFCYVLTCSSFFLVVACSSPLSDTIRFGLNAAPVTLDPRFVTDATSYRICRLLYRALVDFDTEFNAIADLAHWQMLSSTHYRFQLIAPRPTFSDGSIITSMDVKATYDTVLDATLASPHRGTLKIIERIQRIDETTVDFILKHPDPLFPGRLVIGILPAQQIAAKHNFNTEPIGTGPLQLLSQQGHHDLSLQRRADGQIFRFSVIKDDTVRVLKLLRGELDLIQGGLSPDIVQWLRTRPGVIVQEEQGNTFTYIGFNLDDTYTGNLTIRRAIAHAINRDEIITYIMRHTARKAETLLVPEHWAAHRQLPTYSYDPNRARALLETVGISRDEPLQLTYKTSNNSFRIRLATILQSQLQSVGIELSIKSYDWGTFYGDIKAGQFQMYSLSWVGLKMPDIFRYVFHSESVPPQGANRGQYRDIQADHLIEEAEGLLDLKIQAKHYRILQRYLHNTLPYIPLWYENVIVVRKQDIKGYDTSADGHFDSLALVYREKN